MLVALLFSTVMMAETPKDTPAQAAAAAVPVAAKKADNGDAIVCKKEAFLGSKMPRRVCFNAAQMAQKAADDRAELKKQQDQTQLPKSF